MVVLTVMVVVTAMALFLGRDQCEGDGDVCSNYYEQMNCNDNDFEL